MSIKQIHSNAKSQNRLDYITANDVETYNIYIYIRKECIGTCI